MADDGLGHDGNSVYRWVAGLLLSVLLLFGGAFIGDRVNITRWAAAQEALQEHAELPGHPVTIERTTALGHSVDQLRELHNNDMGEIRILLQRIEDKLDRQIEANAAGGPL